MQSIPTSALGIRKSTLKTLARRGRLRHLLADSATALLLVAGHGAIIMCQGMAFSVAMNSSRANATVALLIASNFAEIKGVVLKRFDARRLFILSCQARAAASTAFMGLI